PEQKCPATNTAPFCTSDVATGTACFGSHASSATSSLSFLPSTPPASLMCLTAISAPCLNCSPNEASPPVIGPAVATTISCAAACANVRAATAAAGITKVENLRIV